MIPLSFRTNSLSDRKKPMIFFTIFGGKMQARCRVTPIYSEKEDTGRTKLKETLSLPKQEETDTNALN